MSQSIQTGKTTVSGSVTTTISSQAGVALGKVSGTNNNASTPTTLGTVGASKTWKIVGFVLSGDNGSAGGIETAKLSANGVQIGSLWIRNSSDSAVAISFPASYYGPLTAGQTITLLSANASASCAATVYYIEETV